MMAESNGAELRRSLSVDSRLDSPRLPDGVTRLHSAVAPDSQYAISLRQWRFAEMCELGLARA